MNAAVASPGCVGEGERAATRRRDARRVRRALALVGGLHEVRCGVLGVLPGPAALVVHESARVLRRHVAHLGRGRVPEEARRYGAAGES